MNNTIEIDKKQTIDLITFQAGHAQVTLPKENIREIWPKIKKMIDAYLEVTSN